MREFVFTAGSDNDGSLASAFLRRHGFSARIISGLKGRNGLTRGGEVLRTVDRVYAGDEIRVAVEERPKNLREYDIVPNPSLSVGIAYEDSDLIVFDKPPFMPVHPSIRHKDDTLANKYAALYPGAPFHALYRLDRNTSGLCVCVKNSYFASVMAGGIEKKYYAAADGDITEPGVIDAPIGRAGNSIIKREVRPDGQRAVTRYTPIRRANGRTLLEVTLETGRTHQIRVHLAHIGYPLCGDELYGGDLAAINRHALHCGSVCFSDPLTGERISLESRLPDDIEMLFGAREDRDLGAQS